jgi:competence ComEA-like helix-hairpin-helix protein
MSMMEWLHLLRQGRMRGLIQAAMMAAVLFLAAPAWGLSGQLNVNTASVEELQLLPFIGETRARAIVDHRRRQGSFTSLDELPAGETIGDSTFRAIKPYLTLTGPTTLRRETGAGETAAAGLQGRTRIFGTLPGEIVLLPDAAYYDTLRHYLRQAERRIEIAMFIFKITDSPQNRPAAILSELAAAAGRGVTVTVLLERSGHDDGLNRENDKVARALHRHGVEVVFDKPQITTHTKLVVIDDRFCFVGSHNLTHAALARNHEFSLLIDSRKLAGELSSYIAGVKAGR